MKYWRLDENDYFTENGDQHDFLEVQYMAYMAYGDMDYINSIRECYRQSFVDFNPTRYPFAYFVSKPISRDHIIYSICALKKRYDKGLVLDSYINSIKMSKKRGYRMNLDLFLWLQLQKGKSIGKLWYVEVALYSFVNRLWNKSFYKLTNYDLELKQDEYKNLSISKALKRTLNPIQMLLFPTYALKFTATQLYHEEDNFFTRIAKRNYLDITPKSNYVIRLLLGGKVCKEEVDAYKPMSIARWAVTLNPYTCINEMRVLEDDEYDLALDKDYLTYLYNKQL